MHLKQRNFLAYVLLINIKAERPTSSTHLEMKWFNLLHILARHGWERNGVCILFYCYAALLYTSYINRNSSSCMAISKVVQFHGTPRRIVTMNCMAPDSRKDINRTESYCPNNRHGCSRDDTTVGINVLILGTYLDWAKNHFV